MLERLGVGGMCLVFRARHEGSDADCALKVLKEDRRHDERIRDLFITEADLSLLLDHPNLLRTYDAGEIDGRYYIAMELIEGGTLSQLLERSQHHALAVPPDLALFAASEALEGLHALHCATGNTGRPLGLIHRDVTPSNIFLTFDGRVILGDFGVALIQAYGPGDPTEVLGKLGYLAPEMIALEEVDHRADVFAAGVVLYELLTGQRCFPGDAEQQVMSDILDVRVARPRRHAPHLSRGLENVLMQALARRPKDRFQTAEEFLYALQPHWSPALGNPYAVGGLLRALLGPDRAAQ